MNCRRPAEWPLLLSSVAACAMWAAEACAEGAAEAAVQLSSVEVVGGLLDALAEQRFAAGQKVVIDKDEIAALGGLSVAEVLRKLPGLERAGEGMEAAGAGARGITREAVLVLVNGERPTASGRHALTLVGRLPAGELERIELVRGGSAEFGATAEVVVNLVMRAPRARATQALRATAGVRGDEPNLQLSGSRDGGSGDFAWTLPLTVNRHRMPVDLQRRRSAPDGAAELETSVGGYRVDELILSPRLSWKADERRLTLWPSLYLNDNRRRQAVSRTDAGTAAGSTRLDRERGDIRIARLRADAQTRVGDDSRLNLRLALMDGARDTRTLRRPSAGAAEIDDLDRREREFTAALRLDQPAGAHLLSWAAEGAAFDRDDRQDAGTAAAPASARRQLRERSGALWVQDEWTFGGDALTLTSGLRVDAVRQQAGGGWRGTEALAPSLALRWAFAPSWVLRGSAGGGLRAPKLDEISPLVTRSAGVNTPLEPDVGGRPGLDAERIARFEVGVERYLAGDKSVLGANAYLRRTRDFIEREVADEGGRWVERPANVGDARHWGLELSARLDSALFGGALPAGGSLRATVTLPRAQVDDERLGIRRIANDTPRHVTSLGYEHAAGSAALRYGLQLRHSAAARSARADELRAARRGGTRIDAHLTWQLVPGVDLRLAGENLAGARDRNLRSAHYGDGGWRLAGRDGGERSWLLTLEGKW